MEKRKLKSSTILYLIIIIVIILMLILGKQNKEEDKVMEEVMGGSAGSGMLGIETMPGDADIFLNGGYSGISPITLYNIPVGTHEVVVKKEGYEDFASEIVIEAGKKTYLEASLVLIPVETPVEEKTVVETDEEEMEETPKAGNVINIGDKFSLYYDFSEEEFVNNRQSGSDMFSKRFDKYLVFTRFIPATIKTIDKGIDDIRKDDCIGVKGEFEYVHSGQSLCVITKEGQIAAIGGSWEKTENAELKWKVFS